MNLYQIEKMFINILGKSPSLQTDSHMELISHKNNLVGYYYILKNEI